MTFNRRNLLRSLGLLGPAYFLPWTKGRSARALDPTIPTRLLFFYTPHGTLFRQFVRPAAGATVATETNFALGPTLQPLTPFKDKLLLLEGLQLKSQVNDPIAAPNDHIMGQTHALSAINRASPEASGGISIDEFISRRINTPAPVTPVPILQMSARGNAEVPAYLTSWTGPSAMASAMTNPAAVYTRLFPNGPPSSQGQSAATAAAARKRSILDATLAEFSAVKAPLSSLDKAKLDAHASLIRDLELSIALTPTATCTAPDSTTASAAYKKNCPDIAGDLCVSSAFDGFAKLIPAAFACDITRVITLDIDQLPDSMFSVPDIHMFLHSMDDIWWYNNERFKSNEPVPASAQNAANIQIAVNFYVAYAQMLATLLQSLAAIPEPDGSTLLDHTIVVWCGEVGSTNHLNNMVNYVLAGGGGGFLKTGRYLQLPRTAQASKIDGFPTGGLAHNNLFVSLANAMGLADVTTFGNPSVCTGPLTQLRG